MIKSLRPQEETQMRLGRRKFIMGPPAVGGELPLATQGHRGKHQGGQGAEGARASKRFRPDPYCSFRGKVKAGSNKQFSIG